MKEYYLKNDMIYFPALESYDSWLGHSFSTRKGGVSEGIFASMNLSFQRGDDPKKVMENFEIISEKLGMPLSRFVFSDQTHTANVRIVTNEDAGAGITREKNYTDVDGLITHEKGLVLSLFFADCVPIFLADPKTHTIALLHSSWRGTVARIGEAAVRKMGEAFGSDPADIVAVIGPSICKDCYEVGFDVADEFRRGFEGVLEADGKSPDKYQLDLWEANRQVLLRAGLSEDNITISGLCTCCNPDLLFSHRASLGKRGNLGAFMFLRE